MMDSSNPCLGCVAPERHLGCHDKCEKRAEWLKIHEAKKQHYKKHVEANSVTFEGMVRVGKSVKADGLLYGSKWRNKK